MRARMSFAGLALLSITAGLALAARPARAESLDEPEVTAEAEGASRAASDIDGNDIFGTRCFLRCYVERLDCSYGDRAGRTFRRWRSLCESRLDECLDGCGFSRRPYY